MCCRFVDVVSLGGGWFFVLLWRICCLVVE